MRTVILFIVAAAALVADAKPSQSDIAGLLRRQLPGSSTSSGSSSFPGLDPSSVSGSSDCVSACTQLSNIADSCSASMSCLCSQKNYDALVPCLQCLSPADAQSSLNNFVAGCKDAGYSLNAGSASSVTGTSGSGSAVGATTKSSAGKAKSNGSVVRPDALGAVGLGAVTAVAFAMLGVSFG